MDIDEAEEGTEALRIVAEQRPKLVFMDVRLPGENGLVITRKIRELAPATRVVVLTSYEKPEYLEAAAEDGATCFAIKGTLQMEHLKILVDEMKLFSR